MITPSNEEFIEDGTYQKHKKMKKRKHVANSTHIVHHDFNQDDNVNAIVSSGESIDYAHRKHKKRMKQEHVENSTQMMHYDFNQEDNVNVIVSNEEYIDDGHRKHKKRKKLKNIETATNMILHDFNQDIINEESTHVDIEETYLNNKPKKKNHKNKDVINSIYDQLTFEQSDHKMKISFNEASTSVEDIDNKLYKKNKRRNDKCTVADDNIVYPIVENLKVKIENDVNIIDLDHMDVRSHYEKIMSTNDTEEHYSKTQKHKKKKHRSKREREGNDLYNDIISKYGSEINLDSHKNKKHVLKNMICQDKDVENLRNKRLKDALPNLEICENEIPTSTENKKKKRKDKNDDTHNLQQDTENTTKQEAIKHKKKKHKEKGENSWNLNVELEEKKYLDFHSNMNVETLKKAESTIDGSNHISKKHKKKLKHKNIHNEISLCNINEVPEYEEFQTKNDENSTESILQMQNYKLKKRKNVVEGLDVENAAKRFKHRNQNEDLTCTTAEEYLCDSFRHSELSNMPNFNSISLDDLSIEIQKTRSKLFKNLQQPCDSTMLNSAVPNSCSSPVTVVPVEKLKTKSKLSKKFQQPSNSAMSGPIALSNSCSSPGTVIKVEETDNDNVCFESGLVCSADSSSLEVPLLHKNDSVHHQLAEANEGSETSPDEADNAVNMPLLNYSSDPVSFEVPLRLKNESVSQQRTETNDEGETSGDEVDNAFDVSLLDYTPDPVLFEVPLLHKNESVSQLSAELKDQLRNEGVEIKNGKFTKTENEILERNFMNFASDYNINDADFFFGSGQKNLFFRERIRFFKAKHFYVRLGKDLNDRTLHSIYKHAREVFDPSRQKNYLTKNEITDMMMAVDVFGKKWDKVAEITNCTQKKCYESYKWHSSEATKGKWSHKEIQNLKKAVQNVLGTDYETHAQNTNIDWESVSSQVETRNASQCRLYWLEYLAWNKESKRKKWTPNDYKKLLKLLLTTYLVEDQTLIDWKDLQTHFTDVSPTHLFIHKKFRYMKSKISVAMKLTHKEVLNKLLNFTRWNPTEI